MSTCCRCSPCSCCCASPEDAFLRAQAEAEAKRTQQWTSKWRGAIAAVRNISSSRKGMSSSRRLPRDVVFDCLLQFYAHENFNDALKSLYDVYEVAPHVVRQYLPQLANFLLHGLMPQPERLEAFLLDKSERSLHFSHRMYFFLSAFAPNVNYTSQLRTPVLAPGSANLHETSLVAAVQLQGAIAGARMAQQVELVHRDVNTAAASQPKSAIDQYAASTAGDPCGAGLPPSAAHSTIREAFSMATSALERKAALALVRLSERHKLSLVSGTFVPQRMVMASRPSATSSVSTEYAGAGLSAAESLHESKQLPTGDVCGRTVPHLLSHQQQHFVAGAGVGNPGDQSGYSDTPAICAELTRISYQLMACAPETRNDMLRLALAAVNARFLPSATAYVPLGNVHNRLVAIIPDRSFCFKTKERVPYMAVLEVVDYANRSGNAIDEFDSDDDDDTTDRVVRLQAQRPRLHSRRTRATTIGGASEAAAVAAALVRTAAGAITEGAHALGSFVMRQLGDVRRGADRGSSLETRHRVRGLVSPHRLGAEASGRGRASVHKARRASPADPLIRKPIDIRVNVADRTEAHNYHSMSRSTTAHRPQEMARERERRLSDSSALDVSAHTHLLGAEERVVASARSKRLRSSVTESRDSSGLKRPLISPDEVVTIKQSTSRRDQSLGQWASTPVASPDDSANNSPSGSLFSSYEPPAESAPLVGSVRTLLSETSPISAPAVFSSPVPGEPAPRKLTLGDDTLVNDVELDRELRDLPSELHRFSIEADDDGGDAEVTVGSTAGDYVATAGPGSIVRRSSPGLSKQSAVGVVFAERWREKELCVAATSTYSSLPGWRLMPVIVKANDDLRQEQFASQLLRQFAHIFRTAKLPVWMRPYDILATHADGGLIEAIPDTISVDALKRSDSHFTTLDGWFDRHFNQGPRGPQRVLAARMNFVRSMAAYSIVCYVLNIKDRHNGNILIDRRGHVMHIDFGFLLTNSPGGNMNFEAAPFKLTQEFVQVMGGPRSNMFATFRKLCIQAFLAARKYRERILVLVEMMLSGNRDLKCFLGGPEATMAGLHARFHEDLSDRAAISLVHSLIDRSLDNWRTRWYDAYQRWAQGVF